MSTIRRMPVSVSLLTVLAVLAGPLSAAAITTEDALRKALDDERKAAATYQAVMAEHGEVLPFAHIVEAERRHQRRLTSLFAKYGLDVPADPWPERELEVPATLAAACEQAIAAERANVALYDELLAEVEEDDVRLVFGQLQAASEDHHLPAFQRCVDGGGQYAGPGGGHGRHGEGRGCGDCCGGCAGGAGGCGHGRGPDREAGPS